MVIDFKKKYDQPESCKFNNEDWYSSYAYRRQQEDALLWANKILELENRVVTAETRSKKNENFIAERIEEFDLNFSNGFLANGLLIKRITFLTNMIMLLGISTLFLSLCLGCIVFYLTQ